MAEQGTATDFLSPISTILIPQYRWQEHCTVPACHHTANAVSIFNKHDGMSIREVDSEMFSSIGLQFSQYSKLLPLCFKWL